VTLVLSLLSALAAVLEVTRVRQKFLPFLVFCTLVISMQLTVFSVATLGGGSGAAGIEAIEASAQDQVKRFRGAAKKATQQVSMWNKPPSSGGKNADRSLVPTTIRNFSVVIAAHGEQDYIERTIISILDHTDLKLLREIIVVDDVSNPPLEPLARKAFENAKQVGDVKLTVHRNEKRLGLVQSKITGGSLVATDAMVFLDGHVSPAAGWERPLIRHMETNYKRIVVPVIPIIDEVTWAQKVGAGVGFKMMFDWSLQFNWFDDGNDEVPVLSGGLFAVTKKWWHEGGEYDHGMGMWGGENIEQSLRTWRCGGEIFLARDSKVSHLFRPKFPYAINNTEVHINKIRTVEVWFDEPYRARVLKNIGVSHSLIDYAKVGLEPREQLKADLKCENFQWYMDRFKHVFEERALVGPSFLLEAVQQETSGVDTHARKLCIGQPELTSPPGEAAMLVPCTQNGARRFVEQAADDGGVMFRGRLHNAVVGCLDANGRFAKREEAWPIFFQCSGNNNPMQTWKLEEEGLLTMMDRYSKKQFCLRNPAGPRTPLSFVPCDKGDRSTFLHVRKYQMLDI